MAKDPKFSDPQLASEGVSGEAKCCKEAFCNMVFIALGLLLLVAAALKGYQLYIEPMIVVNALGTLCLVCWEISLGSWLVLGVRTTWTWRATVGCFLVFTIGSGYKLINGAASCGCFGKLEVDPLHTLIVDMIALGFLWTSRQGIEEASSTVMQRVLPRFATIALLACVVAATTAVYGQSRFTRGSGLLESTDELVLLEPETWVGKRWPLIFRSGLRRNSLMANGTYCYSGMTVIHAMK